MARGLSKRVTALENAASLLEQMSDRLKYLQPSMYSLMESMSGTEKFAGFLFPARCIELMDKGLPFPESWRQAIEEDSAPIDAVETDILISLSGILGCADLDSQLAQISFTVSRLEARIEAARSREQKYSKLYRALGGLCGLAAVIMLI